MHDANTIVLFFFAIFLLKVLWERFLWNTAGLFWSDLAVGVRSIEWTGAGFGLALVWNSSARRHSGKIHASGTGQACEVVTALTASDTLVSPDTQDTGSHFCVDVGTLRRCWLSSGGGQCDSKATGLCPCWSRKVEVTNGCQMTH